MSVGKLGGGHQAAIMCLAVDSTIPGQDVIATGSKDHYIKVIIKKIVFLFNFLFFVKLIAYNFIL